jgi:hypothetical protein
MSIEGKLPTQGTTEAGLQKSRYHPKIAKKGMLVKPNSLNLLVGK